MAGLAFKRPRRLGAELPEGAVPDQGGERPRVFGIEVPEGAVLDTPEQSAGEVSRDDPGFRGRLVDDLRERGVQFDEIQQAYHDGDQTLAESILQVIGKVAVGGVLDTIGEGLTSAGRGVADVFETAAPETAAAIGEGFSAAVGSETAQEAFAAMGRGIDAYNEWATENPRAAHNLEAITNIALLLAPVKIKPKIGAPSTSVGRAGKRVSAAATAQIAQRRMDFLDELVSPKLTKAVKEDRIRRTSPGGVFRAGRVEPTAAERAIAVEVGKVAGVKQGNTLLRNLKAVNAAITEEAVALKSALKANPFKISRPQIRVELKNVIARLQERPLLVGNAVRTAERVVRKARMLFLSHPNTGSGILAARKEFDVWVKSQRPKIFDANQSNALQMAVGEVRTAMNDLVARSTPNVAVRESLRKQSNLFLAADNIGAKAVTEATSTIGRLVESVGKFVRLRGAVAGLGTGALGAGAVVSPETTAFAAIMGGIAYAGGRLIMSPKTKSAIGGLLRASEKAIQKARDPATLRQLRADRIAIIEILKMTDTRDE